MSYKKVTIGNRELTPKEREELYLSISCRLGLIETGEPALRAIDAVNSGQRHRLKSLSLEQMKLVIMLEEIMHQLI